MLLLMASITEAFALALQHHKAGQLQAAELIYRQILAIEPNQPDVLHLLGVIAHHGRRYEAAVDLIQKAIRIKPTEGVFHNNLGNVLKEQSKLDDAIAS